MLIIFHSQCIQYFEIQKKNNPIKMINHVQLSIRVFLERFRRGCPSEAGGFPPFIWHFVHCTDWSTLCHGLVPTCQHSKKVKSEGSSVCNRRRFRWGTAPRVEDGASTYVFSIFSQPTHYRNSKSNIGNQWRIYRVVR